MASTPNMPFNLNLKLKMEPIKEIIIKYYRIPSKNGLLKVENKTVIEQTMSSSLIKVDFH